MSHITKILSKVTQERIQKKINIELEEEQLAFRKNNGTREAILYIRMIINKYIKVRSLFMVV
jgi:hypothetical protein